MNSDTDIVKSFLVSVFNNSFNDVEYCKNNVFVEVGVKDRPHNINFLLREQVILSHFL